MALLAEEDGLCAGGCGHPADQAHDPASQRKWSVITTTCEACRVLHAQMQSDTEDKTSQRGRLYGVRYSGG